MTTEALMEKDKIPPEVVIEEEHQEQYGYDVEDTPPLFVIVTSAFQYLFLCMGTVITMMTVLSDTVCADINDPVRSVLFSSSVLVIGITTAVQSFLGLRLPVFQGASASFLIPLLVLKGTGTWTCPQHEAVSGNVTVNATLSTAEITTPETVVRRLAELQGSLIAASVFEVLIGLTGLIGILMKLISPIVIGVTIFCLGYSLYPVAIMLCGAHWGIALGGALLMVLMAVYMSHIRVPLPQCNRKSEQLRSMFPVFQVFPVLITLISVWITCAVCTKFNIFSDDPQHPSYKARTDVRIGIIRNTPWILIPYPGQFGLPGFNTAVFIGFLISVITSIIESVGDYISLSRVCKAYPVPKHAMNRGIAVEGIFSVISGCFGTGHATTSYSTINSLLGITKIRSRLVMIVAGILAIVFAIFGKFGAVMTSVPAPALGAVFLIMIGFLSALGLSSLQSVEMRSSRNISVIGISIYVAIVMAEWQRQFPDSLRTEYEQLNQAIKVTIGNAMFTGFVLSLILDNTVRGSDKERGVTKVSLSCDDHVTSRSHLYDVPLVSRLQKRFRLLRRMPFLQSYVSLNDINEDQIGVD